MHIAVDVSPLESAHKGRGVGVYTKYLIDALEKYEKTNQYSLIRKGQRIPRSADVIHYPFFDPFFLTLPLIKTKPTVVTVHDLIPIVFPNKFPRGFRGDVSWQIQKFSLLKAARVLADSQTSKTDITRLTGFPAEKIDTVYLGPSCPAPLKSREGEFMKFKEKYEIKKPYVLYVGDINWNKNVLELLRAFKRALKQCPSLILVLAGSAFLGPETLEKKDIEKTIETLDLRASVRMPGFVSQEMLPFLYTHASCLLQPSWYEGFGLSVVDAMTFDCPVVVSDVSSLAEIAGPAVRVKPDDSEGIARAIKENVEMSDSERKRRINNQRDWVRQFTWEKTAHETVASYKKAVT